MKRTVLLLAALAVAPAFGVIVDFEDLGVAPGTQLNPPAGVGITSQGFDYTPGPNNASGLNDLHMSSEGFHPYNGTTVGTTHDDVVLTKNGGGVFSLQQFDMAGWSNGNEVAFSVVGIRQAMPNIVANFAPDGVVDAIGGAVDFQTFVMGPGWANLLSVTWNHSGAGTVQGLFALDNIVVDQAGEPTIPEPGTLCVLGFGGLAVLRRRRGR